MHGCNYCYTCHACLEVGIPTLVNLIKVTPPTAQHFFLLSVECGAVLEAGFKAVGQLRIGTLALMVSSPSAVNFTPVCSQHLLVGLTALYPELRASAATRSTLLPSRYSTAVRTPCVDCRV